MKKFKDIYAIIWCGVGFVMILIMIIIANTKKYYTNQYLVTQYTTEYYKWKNDFNIVVHFFEQYYFYENVSIRYSVKGIFIDPYNNPEYQFLTESKFILKNEKFFRNYEINCYKKRVSFTTSDYRNTLGEYVSLVNCPAPEEYFPNCTIYSNNNYPKDTDTNCMYHIEDDWYVRVP